MEMKKEMIISPPLILGAPLERSSLVSFPIRWLGHPGHYLRQSAQVAEQR